MNRQSLAAVLLASLGSLAACAGGDAPSGVRADGLSVTCTVESRDGDTDVYVCEPDDGDRLCESSVEGGASLALWPPNHKLTVVALADCAALPDDCGPKLASATITAITSDEAVDVGAGGDGHTSAYDMRIVDATTVEVRAERQGGGDGRVYRIWYVDADEAVGSCEIQVPHDQGPFHGAIDSGEVVRVDP